VPVELVDDAADKPDKAAIEGAAGVIAEESGRTKEVEEERGTSGA